jgi:hypothetical protein
LGTTCFTSGGQSEEHCFPAGQLSMRARNEALPLEKPASISSGWHHQCRTPGVRLSCDTNEVSHAGNRALAATLPIRVVLVAQRKVRQQFFAHLELDDVSHKSTASVRRHHNTGQSRCLDDTIDTGTEGTMSCPTSKR